MFDLGYTQAADNAKMNKRMTINASCPCDPLWVVLTA